MTAGRNEITSLERPRSWIAGAWSAQGTEFGVADPSGGTVITTALGASPDDVDRAGSSARAAFQQYRRATPATRGQWCASASAAILAEEDLLARELSREHGKPLGEALGEVRSAAHGWRVAAASVLATPDVMPQVADPSKRVLTRREPRGVWAVVTPWNFPLNIPMEYLGPAIATGNAVVWKPAPTTARIAAVFLDVLHRSELPSELIQLVLTDELDVARYLTEHPQIDAVGFTGGSSAGRAIERACFDKHLLLELGGNTAIVVHDDADLATAAAAIASASFWNGGQVCSAAGKIVATRQTAGDLAARLVAHAEKLVVGDPLEPGTQLGPQHLESGIERVQALVDDATGRGARLLTGGHRLDQPGSFYPATVLIDVPQDARIFTEETFGPVAAITVLDDESGLVEAANQGTYGLCAAVFTTALDRAFATAEQIDAGLVVVNDTSNWWELTVPFGGAAGRDSGRGRLGGVFTLGEFTQVKTIALDVS